MNVQRGGSETRELRTPHRLPGRGGKLKKAVFNR